MTANSQQRSRLEGHDLRVDEFNRKAGENLANISPSWLAMSWTVFLRQSPQGQICHNTCGTGILQVFCMRNVRQIPGASEEA